MAAGTACAHSQATAESQTGCESLVQKYRSTRRPCRPEDQKPACPCRARVFLHARALGPAQTILQAIAVGRHRTGVSARRVAVGQLQRALVIATRAEAIDSPGCDRICGLSPGTASLQTSQSLTRPASPSFLTPCSEQVPARAGREAHGCQGRVETGAPCCRIEPRAPAAAPTAAPGSSPPSRHAPARLPCRRAGSSSASPALRPGPRPGPV
jgi:hypothetical protein